MAFGRLKNWIGASRNFAFLASGLLAATVGSAQGLVSSDLAKLRSVGSVAVCPDGKRVAYTVVMRDRPGRPYGQLWILDLASNKANRIGGDRDGGGNGVWSPDGKWIAFPGRQGEKGGLFM